MFTGRYLHQSPAWRIDMRVELSTTNQEIIDISGDIFQRLSSGEVRYFSSFSMDGGPVPVQALGGSIQVQFKNRIFITRGGVNPGTPKRVEVLLEAPLTGSQLIGRVNFHFCNLQPHFPLNGPFTCRKKSTFLRQVEIHLFYDKFNFALPFPLRVMPPAQMAATPHQPADALKEIYRREQIQMNYARGGPVLLNRQSPNPNGWRRRDLHDLMINSGFDPPPTDPVWKIWSFVTDQFDLSDGAFVSLAGYSFDNFGDRNRQGIALFMQDPRFQGLSQPPGTPQHAQAHNAFLFTLAHELAHSMGVEHTRPYRNIRPTQPEPPDMMNEDFSVARGNTNDWRGFTWGFIPEIGQLLRHGAWVDMAPGTSGGAFASGKRALKTATPGLSLRICSQKSFLCAEPLEIEVRLRCRNSEQDLTVSPAFAPEAGVITYQFRPAGTRKWQEFVPLTRLHGIPTSQVLKYPDRAGLEGQDRISGLVPLYFGSKAISLFEEGVYQIRATYRDTFGQSAYSNIHTLRITGAQQEWIKHLLASSPAFRNSFLEFCYLNGSAEARFASVRIFLMRTLRQLNESIHAQPGGIEKGHLLRLRAKFERLLGLSLGVDRWTLDFSSVPEQPGSTPASPVLKRWTPTHNRYERATRRMDRCIRYFQRQTQSKRQNFAYRRAAEEQVNMLNSVQQPEPVAKIRQRLENDLKGRGVPANILQALQSKEASLATV